ncbi:MAG TPA: hypothetical protein VF944_09710, partial [Candidatus Bathyarchaeia archaeon]
GDYQKEWLRKTIFVTHNVVFLRVFLTPACGIDLCFSTHSFSKCSTCRTGFASAREYMSSVNIKVGRPASFAPVWEMLECSST